MGFCNMFRREHGWRMRELMAVTDERSILLEARLSVVCDSLMHANKYITN
jgi:hypothetical protein